MILKKYNRLHIISLVFVSILVLGRGSFVITEDRAVAAIDENNNIGISTVDTMVDTMVDTIKVMDNIKQEPVYDNYSDDSLQKYLGNGNVLIDSSYVPGDLTSIQSDFTSNNSRRFQLRTEAAENFADMAWNFWNTRNGDRLVINSAYRSGKFQESMIKKGCSSKKCAKVGSSEHQLGLAIDIGVVTKGGKYIELNKGNKYYEWLSQNAKNWGFHNTFQKGVEIDGQMEEGWHWRYLGEDLASKLYDEGLTFGERIKVKDNLSMGQLPLSNEMNN